MRIIAIDSSSSGAGDNSLALALLSVLRSRGWRVQSYKVGPDLSDLWQHQAATGRPAVTLDGFLLPSEGHNLRAFLESAGDADICVLEGNGGLFDGTDGKSEDGSTAQVAKLLGAPVCLVLDPFQTGRSAAAMLKGYKAFDSQLRLEAILLSKAADEEHARRIESALEEAGVAMRVLGAIHKDERRAVHGLQRVTDDRRISDAVAQHLAHQLEENVDLDALVQLASQACMPPVPEGHPAVGFDQEHHVRLAVARDAAFSMYYSENLALLEKAGAELLFFSPMHDALPQNISGIYFGGGCPERYPEELTANRQLMAAVAAFAEAGGVVYAEYAGLVYLSQSLQPVGNLPYAMAGVFPFRAHLTANRLKRGYVEVTVEETCSLFDGGQSARGFVCHTAEILQERVVGGLPAVGSGRRNSLSSRDEGWQAGYSALMQTGGAKPVQEGYNWRNVLASFVHVHFGSCPALAAQLVERCAAVDVSAVSAAASAAAEAHAGPRSFPLDGSSCNGVHRQRDYKSATVSPESAPGFPGASRPIFPVWSSPNLQNLGRACSEAIGQPHDRHQDRYTDMDRAVSMDGPYKQYPPAGIRPRSPSTTLSRAFSSDMLCRSPTTSPLPGSPTQPRYQDTSFSPGEEAYSSMPSFSWQLPPVHPSTSAAGSSSVPMITASSAPLAFYPAASGSLHPSIQPVVSLQHLNGHSHAEHGMLSNASSASTRERERMQPSSGRPSQDSVQSWSFDHHPHSTWHHNSESIVSLLPGATEILFALGLGPRVAAVTERCDWPKEAGSRSKAVRCMADCTQLCPGAAQQPGSPSSSGAAVVDVELLARENPGLVLAQESNHSCSADAQHIAEVAPRMLAVFEAMQRAGLCGPHSATRLLVLNPCTLSDALQSILEVGAAADVAAEALRCVDALRARLRKTARSVAGPASRPRVLVLESVKPLTLGGMWLPEMVDLAGGCDDLQEPGASGLPLAWDQVRSHAPEVLVLMQCGVSPQGVLAGVTELAALPGWWSLPAVKNGCVYIVDHAPFLRPGPRVVEGVEMLARMLHTDAVQQRCPEGSVLKLALQGGQRCRQSLVPNYFLPFQ